MTNFAHRTGPIAAPRAKLRTSVRPVDAAVSDHLSQTYWDWRSLYDRDAEAYPLQQADFVLTDLRFERPSRLVPVLVSAEADDQTQSLAVLTPKTLATARVGSFGLHRTLQGLRLVGNRLIQPTTDAQLQQATLQAVFQHVREAGAQFLLIEDVDTESDLATALTQVLPASWMQFRHAGMQPRRRIQLPTNPDDYWNKFSKKTQQTWRRKLKKFGQTRLERITTTEQVPRFLELAHHISQQTWQSRQLGLRVRNDERELRGLISLAEHGLLRSYLWLSDDQPVAFIIGNQDKSCFHYEEVGYATPFAKNSPGLLMLWQTIDDILHHDRPEWFDFGGGDADYKQLFATHESRSGTLWLFPPTITNLATVTYLRSCRTVRHTIRRSVVNFGLATRARQWIRYGRATTPNKPGETTPDD